MKLCKDCKHCQPNDEWLSDGYQLRYALCGNRPSPVTGIGRIKCRDERRGSWFFDTCGTEGKYWEAK